MFFTSGSHALTVITQIVFVDLLLSGDNAVLIALVCRDLPSDMKAPALVAGTVAAITLRTVLTGVAGVLLQLPLIEIGGALLLLVVAIRLLVAEEQKSAGSEPASGFWGAVATIVLADLAMSLDNVVAIAGAANGSLSYLLFGLALSIPLLMFGSTFVGRLLETRPLLVPAGAALLGWIAGHLAVSDPLWAATIARQLPALHVVVPALCAVFVVAEGRIVAERLRVAGPAPKLRRADSAAAAVPARAREGTPPVPAPALCVVPTGTWGAAEPVGAAINDAMNDAMNDAVAEPGWPGAGALRGPSDAQPLPLTTWQRIERAALKVYVPLVVVSIFALLAWMGWRVIDIQHYLPPPRAAASATRH